ncbi:hypothetical protein [Halorubrum halodurans]|uniref:hypothetical protein n=1 Tax=Halorubrum halodurans TaxID=1383851 RepID=UPI00117AFD60|nr:hypothetical protein [Halorubrum halodurans]
MLEDSQKETIADWEESNSQDKNSVKNHLAENLAELSYIRELSPEAAEEIVEMSISKYEERKGGPNFSTSAATNLFLEQVMAVIFSGFSEKAFNYAVNSGVESSLQWRAQNEDFLAKRLLAKIECTEGGDLLNSDMGLLNQQLATPPEDEEERLRRIFMINGNEILLIEKYFQQILNTDLDKIELDEDYTTIKEADNSVTRPPILVQEAKHAIKNSRERAEALSLDLANPRVDLVRPYFGTDTRPPDWYIREYIELFRDYLNEEGILPDEEEIPSYAETAPTTQDPTRLNLKHWGVPKDE